MTEGSGNQQVQRTEITFNSKAPSEIRHNPNLSFESNTTKQKCLPVYNMSALSHSNSGLAHLRFSIIPVFGQRISCQETGSMVAPGVEK
jgi:hypothetical protein